MGMVFLARDTRTGEKVALKILKPAVAGNARAAAFFRKEVNHLANLSHPHIMRVLESAPEERMGWFAMPFLERGSLDRMIHEQGPLPPEQAVQIARQVAEALAFAHSRGIIHRDLKPRNVLLTDDGQARLADFGLARSLENDELLDAARPRVEGTVHYMSPQAAAGEQEDTRGDIYALGALLYEMLTGKAPYFEAERSRISEAIAAGPPTPILKVNPKASKPLAQVADWAMARELKERYARVEDVLTDLRKVRNREEPDGPHGQSWFAGKVRSCGRAMREPRKAASASVLLAVAVFSSWWLLTRPHLKIVSAWAHPTISNWIGLTSARWLTDPTPVFFLQRGEQLFEISAQGRIMTGEKLRVPGIRLSGHWLAADTDSDGIDELFLSWTQGRKLTIASLRKDTSMLRFHAEGADPHPKDREGEPASVLRPMRFLPATVDADGRTNGARLLATLHTNRSKRPRALCCYDYAAQGREWQTLVGPSLRNLEMLDLDGDGIQEILCGSAADCNGNREPDAGDDEHSYIFAFENNGKIRWAKEIRGERGSSEVGVVDLDGDGQKEILAFASCNEVDHSTNAPLLGRVLQLNPRDGQILHKYDPRTCLLSFLTHDLEGDGKTEILATDCDGNLHLLNWDVTLRKVIRIAPALKKPAGSLDIVDSRLKGMARLHKGQPPFIVAVSWETQDASFSWGRIGDPVDKSSRRNEAICILDSALRVVTRYAVADRSPTQFAWDVMITDLEGDGEDEILLLSDRAEVLKLASLL